MPLLMSLGCGSNKIGRWKGCFDAMASPCEILLHNVDYPTALMLLGCAMEEAKRIEAKFSRYLSDNVVHTINNSHGSWIGVDDETQGLLDFSSQLFELSNGFFDITSGVLRKVWQFCSDSTVPDQRDIEAVLPYVGWGKVRRKDNAIALPIGMQIDFGGVAKEYAVDRTLQKMQRLAECQGVFDGKMLVNFGGDIACSMTSEASGNEAFLPWDVGVEHVNEAISDPYHIIQIFGGGLATSGDTRRFLQGDGRRYSHILNPKTGWPIERAPHSVTVAADTCIEAGMLATLAILEGKDCETMLVENEVNYWLQP